MCVCLGVFFLKDYHEVNVSAICNLLTKLGEYRELLFIHLILISLSSCFSQCHHMQTIHLFYYPSLRPSLFLAPIAFMMWFGFTLCIFVVFFFFFCSNPRNIEKVVARSSCPHSKHLFASASWISHLWTGLIDY